MTENEAIEELSVLLAGIRVPPSTVYMDNSHNPTPSEQRKARDFINRLIADLDVLQ